MLASIVTPVCIRAALAIQGRLPHPRTQLQDKWAAQRDKQRRPSSHTTPTRANLEPTPGVIPMTEVTRQDPRESFNTGIAAACNGCNGEPAARLPPHIPFGQGNLDPGNGMLHRGAGAHRC